MTAANPRCIECGYDLRGLTAEGACPECGKQIGLSLRWHELSRSGKGPPLSMAAPAWVRSLGTACLLFVAAAA